MTQRSSTSSAVNDGVVPETGQLFSPAENTEFEQIQLDVKNFDDYEKQFQEVLMTLEGDDILESFRAEYLGLHHSFLKSHEGESRLLRKCMDLQNDIYSCVSKAHSAEELATGDKQTIDKLKLACETTSKKGTQSKEKEGALREKMDRLRKDVMNLERLATEPVEAAAQEAALQSLMRVYEAVLKERENQDHLVSAIQYDISFAERRLQKLRDSKASNDTELRTVRAAVEEKLSEVSEVMARKAEKEEELRAVRDNMARRTALLAERQRTVEQLTEEHTRNGEELRRAGEEAAALTEEYQVLCRQLQNTNSALQECNEDNDALQRRTNETMVELQTHQSTVFSTHKTYVKESKLLEAMGRRNVVAEEKRQQTQQDRDALRDTLRAKEAELEQLNRATEAAEKQLASVNRERDLLFQDYMGADQQTQRNTIWLAEKQAQLRHSEHELAAFEEQAQQQNESLFHVTRECMNYEEQAKKHAFACATMMAEVRSRERRITETQQQIRDTEARITQQQSMLDTIVSDRNAYAKHYGQLRSELAAMNKKFELVLVQIQQMKDEVSRRDHFIIVEDEEIAGLQRQRKEMEGHIIAFQRHAEKKARGVGLFNVELRNLSGVLAAAEEEVTRQRRRCREMIHERDLLTTKTVQRTKEMTTLYEKIHTQQALLQRAEETYRDRVKHLEQLDYQASNLAQQLTQMRQFVERVPDLRLLVNSARRDLTKQKVQVRVMLDECERPLNLHPGHELAWSEPETAELAERARSLQRELNDRRQQLTEKEERIQVTEQQYMRARAAVAKQPGPEVAEQLSTYQAALVKKREQMRQMTDSLKYFREQTEHYRSRHDELRDRLAEMAKEYAVARDRNERAGAAADGTADGGGDGGASGGGADFVYTGFVAPPLNPQAGVTEAH